MFVGMPKQDTDVKVDPAQAGAAGCIANLLADFCTADRQSNATRISRPPICMETLIFNQLPHFQPAAGSGPTGRDPLAQPNGLGGAAPRSPAA